MSFLAYGFMQRALIVGTLLAIMLPLIGLPVTLKRLSMMGDTLAHASLAGVAAGLCFGFNPLLGSVAVCVIASLCVEAIRTRMRAYQEISTVVVLAAAIGCAGIFSSFGQGSKSISSYLFGSIITIDHLELLLVGGAFVALVIFYLFVYKRLFLSVFDPLSAELMGINQKVLNVVFAFVVAVCVSVAAKTIGSLIVSSLLVIPSITAMQMTKTYRGTLLLSMCISLVVVYLGLCMSYFYNLMPGAVIVLLACALLVVVLVLTRKRA